MWLRGALLIQKTNRKVSRQVWIGRVRSADSGKRAVPLGRPRRRAPSLTPPIRGRRSPLCSPYPQLNLAMVPRGGRQKKKWRGSEQKEGAGRASELAWGWRGPSLGRGPRRTGRALEPRGQGALGLVRQGAVAGREGAREGRTKVLRVGGRSERG